MGDEAHGGGKSAARCLSSHDVEAAYQSRAPGRSLASVANPLPTSGRGVVSADGWWLQLPKLLEPRPQQGSVRPARAPLSAGAAVTITTTSAKGAGDNKSRRSHSPPT